MDRRRVVASGLALAAMAPGLARAQAATTEWRLGEAFEGLESFLSLANDKRAHFTLGYFLTARGRRPNDIIAYIAPEGGARIPVAVGTDGRILRMPRLEELKSPARFVVEVSLDESPTIGPRVLAATGLNASINPRDLDLALSEANAWLKAGGLPSYSKTLAWVNFTGGISGKASFEDGTSAPLPLMPRPPRYVPAEQGKAISIELQQAPTMVYLSEANGPGPQAPVRGLPSEARVRALLVNHVGPQRNGVGIVVGMIDATGRRVIAEGVLGKDDPRRVDNKTLFEIGSVTKVFTALLLTQMVERGEVALNDPVAKYLPAGVTVPERGGKQITLTDLATHTSGLPRLPNNFKPKDPANPYIDYDADQLYAFLKGYTLPRDIGATWEYSNLATGLLGHALARRAGVDYETLVRQRITGPLAMNSTAATLSPELKARFAKGYDIDLAPVSSWEMDVLAGAGALRSDVDDMLTFLSAELGFTPAPSPLPAAMAAQMAVRRPGQGVAIQALGWNMTTFGGVEIADKGGDTAGYHAYLGLDMKRRCGVVVLGTGGSVGGIGANILQSRPLFTTPAQVDVDPKVLAGYAGKYRLSVGPVADVTVEDGALFVQLTDQPKARLYASSPTEFFFKVVDAQVTFAPSPDGKTTRLVLHQNGQDVDASRI